MLTLPRTAWFGLLARWLPLPNAGCGMAQAAGQAGGRLGAALLPARGGAR
jgi:hypothetical protein